VASTVPRVWFRELGLTAITLASCNFFSSHLHPHRNLYLFETICHQQNKKGPTLLALLTAVVTFSHKVGHQVLWQNSVVLHKTVSMVAKSFPETRAGLSAGVNPKYIGTLLAIDGADSTLHAAGQPSVMFASLYSPAIAAEKPLLTSGIWSGGRHQMHSSDP
jgi:hypothetical protein